MTRTLAAVAATALTVGLTGVAPATAAPSESVPVMPGALNVWRTLVTDDHVYVVSDEPGRGREIFARTLATTEGEVVLGPATRLALTSGTALAEHDGTLAYLAPGTGDLVLRAPDGTTTTPDWGRAGPDGGLTPDALTESWLVSGTVVVDRETGEAHDLADLPIVTRDGAPADVPAGLVDLAVEGVVVSEDRALWTVRGTDWVEDGARYGAVLVADLGPDGAVGAAVAVAEASGSDVVYGRFATGALTDDSAPVWLEREPDSWESGEYVAGEERLAWLGADLAGEPDVVVLEGHDDSELLGADGTVVVVADVDYERDTGLPTVDLEWIDLAGDPVEAGLAINLVGEVEGVHGTLVTHRPGWNGPAELLDAAGRLLTADDTLPPPVQRFDDVGLGHPFFDDVDWMASQFIAEGYADGLFRPTAPVTRQATAAFFHRMAGSPYSDWDGIPPFPDVQWNSPFIRDVAWFRGLADGYPDGLFHPAAPVSRQAMAAFLYRYAGSPDVPVDGAPFPDVPADHAFAEAVTWLARTRITGGYDDGTFRPTAPVSRQAMAAFLHRFVEGGYGPVVG